MYVFCKHEFACITISAVHSNTGSVYEHELPWNTSSFVYSSSFRHENNQNRCEKVLTSIIVSLLWHFNVHVMKHCLQYSAMLADPCRQTRTRTRINVNAALHWHPACNILSITDQTVMLTLTDNTLTAHNLTLSNRHNRQPPNMTTISQMKPIHSLIHSFIQCYFRHLAHKKHKNTKDIETNKLMNYVNC